eukprot:scaffold14338_cov153-Isochrysis_galbana.AAC.1
MKLSDVFENLILARAQEVAPAARTGRPRALSDAQVTTLLFKLLRTGCQWRELDCGSASFMAVYRRLQLWERKNVIEDAYKRALETYSKLRPPKRHLMDSSHVRNRHGRRPNTGRNHVDRGRQGTKVSVVTDDARIVYGMHLAPSNRPDVVLLDETLDCRWNPDCGPKEGQLGHLFNRDRMGATNIGRNLARLLDNRPLISSPEGIDTELIDLDAELHNN